MNDGSSFVGMQMMPMTQAPSQGYAMASNRPAVPARAGGIPVLPTATFRGVRGSEPAAPVRAAVAPVAAPAATRSALVVIPSPEELGLGSATVKATAPGPRPTALLDWRGPR